MSGAGFAREHDHVMADTVRRLAAARANGWLARGAAASGTRWPPGGLALPGWS